MSCIHCLFLRKFVFLIFIIFILTGCSNEDDITPLQANVAVELYDQSYGDEPIQTLDVYLPAGRSIEDTPLLIYIHGGAWISGNKKEFAEYRNSLVKSFPEYAFV